MVWKSTDVKLGPLATKLSLSQVSAAAALLKHQGVPLIVEVYQQQPLF